MKKYYERYWEHDEELEDFNYKWPKIKHFIPKEKNIKLLDFGCGKGKILKEILLVNPTIKPTGIDISEKALAFAKKKLPDVKFYKIEEDKKFPFLPKSFDFITTLDVMEHVYDTEFTFSELYRVLKPGGKLLISVPYYGLIKNLIIALTSFEFVYDPRTPHIRFYTKRSLLNEIERANLTPAKIGFYGRFFPVWRGMYCLCKK